MVTSVLSLLMAGPRVYQKMAEDGVMPKLLRSSSGTPRAATIFQAALSIAAVFAASLLELMTYLGLTLSVCGAAAVLSLWWMRWRLPDATPLRWWENVSLAVYICITALILAASFQTHFEQFIAMLVTIGVGGVFYCGWRWSED